MENIPLVDLAFQHRAVAAEVLAGMTSVMERTAFVGGPEVGRFEQEFATFTGATHCVGVGNGTDAIELALRAIGVRAGHEVIVPANTFVATAEAVQRIGADVVCADVDDDCLLMDPLAAEAAVTSRTAAIIPVHLFGQLAPMAPLIAIGSRLGIPVVEDAAQAQGATQAGRGIGTFGVAAATSFYPGKNLGAYGDAGAVLSDSAEIADAVRTMSNHGSRSKYQHETFGMNSRLDTIQAVVLSAKLRQLEAWNKQRQAAALLYDQFLADLPHVRRPVVAPGNDHVWHLYVVRVEDRTATMEKLEAAGIGAGIHYPVPVHLQGSMSGRGYRAGDFPVAEAAASRILSLPIFPGITADQQERVAAALR
jgi:dTDP-4-amino-4,6-dideoxygalactose transaminase